MGIGAIIAAPSTPAARRVIPAGIALRTMVAIATQQVHGVSILTRSTAEAKPAPAAARRTMTMPITAIPMGAGQGLMIRSTSARKRAPLAEIPVRNMQTTPTQTATANATTAVQWSV